LGFDSCENLSSGSGFSLWRLKKLNPVLERKESALGREKLDSILKKLSSLINLPKKIKVFHLKI